MFKQYRVPIGLLHHCDTRLTDMSLIFHWDTKLTGRSLLHHWDFRLTDTFLLQPAYSFRKYRFCQCSSRMLNSLHVITVYWWWRIPDVGIQWLLIHFSCNHGIKILTKGAQFHSIHSSVLSSCPPSIDFHLSGLINQRHKKISFKL